MYKRKEIKKMKRLSKLLYVLTLLFVVNTATAQFITGDFNEVVEYCHIDIIDNVGIMHRDYKNEIAITKDSMNIKLDNDDELNFVLGGFVYIPEGEARAIRYITNTEHPEDKLMGMYIKDQALSIRSLDTGGTIWFYLKDVCNNMEKLPNGGWFLEEFNEKK